MWAYDDASRLGASDMDGRRCSSFEVEFDACDPLGSVLEWSGRVPARVLRRRCRSEGLDRSPYEDGTRELRSADNQARSRAQANKSFFTLNNPAARFDRFQHECSRIAAENGDYLMAQEQHRLHGYQPGKTRFHKTPIRPEVEASRLPKVDELLEKADFDMDGYIKQPLKSILNKPIPKSPPHGILKKPKCKYQDPKSSVDGRRRQRASSESDNFFCNYNYGSPIPGYDTRLTYLSNNVKRVKDNAGVYSYSTSVHSTTPIKRLKSPTKLTNGHKSPTGLTNGNSKCSCKDQVTVAGKDEVHLLRTTAINDIVVEEDSLAELPRQDTSACPAVSPALPVSSVTNINPKPVKKKKTKTKVLKQNHTKECNGVEAEAEDGHSRSPSPDVLVEMCRMDTDVLLPDRDKHDGTTQANDSELTGKPGVKPNGALKKNTSKESPISIPESISSCLRPSLFPRVPPYLKFVGHEDGAPLKIPPAIQKHLKWKLTTITPIVVKKTLTNSGFRLVKSECDTSECPQEETVEWIGIWGKHMKSLMFRAIKDGQKMNHFPGTFQIGRKDRLWRNLQKLTNKYGSAEFGIMPKTYVLPHDLKLLKHDWEKHAANNEKWIIKPPASARGTGIKVVSRWTQIPKKRPVVVQRYVSAPYLINGSKFDMRLYVLVTSLHPLRIYLFKDGLARFASVKYNDELSSLNDRYMHLTNYSINRLSKNYTPNEDFNACEGHKWTLQTLFHYLKTEKNVDTDALWESMKDLVIKTIISGEYSISSLTKANITSRYNCYELFGIDVLLDEDLKPWLLEVNISPSLHSASPLDIHVKGPLVSTVLNIAQYQVPAKTNLEMLSKEKPHKLAGILYDSRLYTVYLSKEERDKHIIYTNMEQRDMYLRDILSTLTPDDVRHLIQAEDELTQTGDMQRIFPSLHTHKYLNYLAGPRYYNRLFDAWETRYALNRESGLTLLRNLCDIGYHLEVPPVPLKNDVDAPTPSASVVSAASRTSAASAASAASPHDPTPA